MSSPEIRIGLIGPGGMGTVHLRNYEHIEGARVVAVCAHSPASAERAGAECVDVYTDADAMLSRGDIDLVDICTPTYTHPEHVKNALLHDKHVICEKPLALHAADARELFALARERGKRLFVAQVLRYSTPAAVLRELVQSGEYGRMLDAQFLRLSACPRWSKSGWLFRREQSGHIPFDLHIHDLDLILSLWGEPESVSCTSTGREGLDYREHYRFSYVFPGGATVSAEAAWYNADIPFTATWRVYFESAVAVFDGEKVTVYAFDREPRVISTEEMLAASKFCPEFTLDTVYSRSAEKARAFAEKWGAPHWTDSLEALAASESVDAVYIASPNALHCEQTLLMLRGGKHVLCEKPIARCAVELETMLSAAQERGLVLLQAMRSAFLPTIPLLREEIARIGPVRRARFSYCQYSSRYDKFKNGIIENAFDPRLGNGALMDIGAYCVNLMVLLFGAPRAVTAKAVFLPGSIDALGTAICEYDGFHAELEYSKVDQSDCISEISGESGSLRFWPTAAPLNVVSVRKGKILELASDPCGEYDMRYELERFVLLTRGGDAGEWTECTRIAAGVMDEIRRQCGIDFTIH